MNKTTIIGNLTRDPELRTTPNGINVCSFTVAVNRRNKQGENDADFFRVSAWRGLAENCNKYLQKGRKVCVIGPVRINEYKAQDGSQRAQLAIDADDVEFLSSRNEDVTTGSYTPREQAPVDPMSGMADVSGSMDELPF